MELVDDFTALVRGDIGAALRNWGFGRAHGSPEWDRISESVRPVIGAYCETIRDRIAAGHGLVVGGPVGTGKTSVLAWIARQVHVNCPDTWLRVYRAPALFDALHSDEFENPAVGVLMIDDLGTEFRSENSLAPSRFDELIDYRWREFLPTLVTTNLTYQALRSIPELERAIDRLKERNAWLRIDGKSQRQQVVPEDWGETT